MSLTLYNKLINQLRKYKYPDKHKLSEIPPHSNSLKTNINSIELFNKGITTVNSNIVKENITKVEVLSHEIKKLDISQIKKDLISNHKVRKEYKLSQRSNISEK